MVNSTQGGLANSIVKSVLNMAIPCLGRLPWQDP